MLPNLLIRVHKVTLELFTDLREGVQIYLIGREKWPKLTSIRIKTPSNNVQLPIDLSKKCVKDFFQVFFTITQSQ